ncbi:hypothetical protein V1477_001306 [Vespula maculifrons]|uniref:Uncharacterized protein n=1 Tax=Vespula maculifrons TaxID=7453 RepID=A0ABD2CZJ2_VESMC
MAHRAYVGIHHPSLPDDVIIILKSKNYELRGGPLCRWRIAHIRWSTVLLFLIFFPNGHPSFIHQSIADNLIFMSECFLVGSLTRLRDILENIKSAYDVGTISMSECFLVGSLTRLRDIRENIKSTNDVGVIFQCDRARCNNVEVEVEVKECSVEVEVEVEECSVEVEVEVKECSVDVEVEVEVHSVEV